MKCKTVFLTTKHGVRLATDIYIPPNGGTHPVVIVRTVYGRKNLPGAAPFLNRHGYALVIQDVRGSGESSGDFRFLPQEPKDAIDTAEWILSQPWCDGRLAILGISYLAAAAIPIAAEFPEHVKAAIWVTVPVRKDLLCYEGGALRLHHTLPWVYSKKASLANFDPELFKTLPLMHALGQEGSCLWQKLLRGGPGSKFWEDNNLWPYVEQTKIPGLHFGGWYDFIFDATLIPFLQMCRSSAPQKLIIGPWSHNGVVGTEKISGDISYGYWKLPDSEDSRLTARELACGNERFMVDTSSHFLEELIKWLDYWVKRKDTEDRQNKEDQDSVSVRCFFTGYEPHWAEFCSWPPKESKPVKFYLSRRSKEQAGELQNLYSANPCSPSNISEDIFSDTFVYDPMNPVPTEGGAVWLFSRAGTVPGPQVSHSHLRQDVLVYDSLELKESFSICGPVYVELYASSTAKDTDFTAKLVDVDKNGTARVVTDGILRARYRNGLEKEEFLVPGKVYKFHISLKACAHTFGPGHKIRLEISSSNFPKYDRNLNNDEPIFESKNPQTARQTVYFGPGMASCLIVRRV